MDTAKVVQLINEETGEHFEVGNIKDHLKNERTKQFNALIKERFDKKQLIKLFEWIETRDDKKVQSYVTENADVPTIFEYLLGISWYIISDYKFDILESLNMSLDADLLPKRHAAGGQADIIVNYNGAQTDGKHKLMLEATLTSKTNQRHAEMEPVSRHLGNLKAENPDTEVYCIFVASHLDKNVIVDLRMRKETPFYVSSIDDWIEDNKIIPLSTQNLRFILQNGMSYEALYELFEKAYQSKVNHKCWYEEEIHKHLS